MNVTPNGTTIITALEKGLDGHERQRPDAWATSIAKLTGIDAATATST